MSPVEWYYAHDNQQSGPVSAVELKQLAVAGRLLPDDLVWREGMTEWSVARNVRGLFGDSAVGPASAAPQAAAAAPSAAPPPPATSAPLRHPFDSLLDGFRPRFTVGLVDSLGRFFRACGVYGLLAAVVLSVVFSILMAFKANVADSLLSGAIALIVLLILQYVSGKFCDLLLRLNGTNADSLASTVFPDGVSMLSKALGVTALLGSIIAAVQTGTIGYIVPGIAGFLLFGYLSLAAICPASLNYTIGSEAGEKAQPLRRWPC